MTDDAHTPRMSAHAESAVVMLTQVWVAVSAIATQSLLAWMLGPAKRGSYAVCVLFASVLGVVFTIGIDRSAQYFVMSRRISISAGVTTMSVMMLAGSAIAIAVGYFMIQAPITFFDQAEPVDFMYALLLIPLMIAWTAYRLMSAGLRRFVPLAKIDVVRTTTNIGLLLALVMWLGLDVPGAILAQAVCLFIVVALIILDLGINCGLRWQTPATSEYVQIASYGMKYYGARIGHVIDTGMGTFMLAFFSTRAELGLFAAASAVTLSLLMLPQSIEAALLPRIADDPLGRPKLVAQVARVSTEVTLFTVAVLIVVADPVVRILLSPAFIEAVPVIQILGLGVVVQSFGIILMSFFRGNNRPEICSYAVWSGLLVNALGILTLYPVMGLLGAAVAVSLGYATRVLFLTVAFCRANKLSALDLMLPKRSDFDLMQSVFSRIASRFKSDQSL